MNNEQNDVIGYQTDKLASKGRVTTGRPIIIKKTGTDPVIIQLRDGDFLPVSTAPGTHQHNDPKKTIVTIVVKGRSDINIKGETVTLTLDVDEESSIELDLGDQP